MKLSPTLLIRTGLALAILVLAYLLWHNWETRSSNEGLVSGNGRIEATEIDVASKIAGRVDAILVQEGDFIEAGQTVARMQALGLQAQQDEAMARLEQAHQSIAGAQAQVVLRQSELEAVQALVEQRKSELEAAQKRLLRSETLAAEGASSIQELDDDRAKAASLKAAWTAAQAQAKAAQAALNASGTQVTSAQANLKAAQATVDRIAVDLADTELKAPRAGRVQFLVAHAGEVIGAGGKVLNLADISDVFMTFFLPETVAGRVALGSEVRIVLDAAPEVAIPAKVSFVSSTAQFTPKTVETASERQKLMFRVRAQIDPALLSKHREQVKTGLPGVAWLKTDPKANWPTSLPALLTP